MSTFVELSAPTPDKVFGIVNQYLEDKRPEKVNLAIGAYADAEGKTICFRAVAEAVQRIAKDFQTGYLTPAGDREFCDLSQKLLYQSAQVNDSIASVQAPSGTGALTLAASLTKMIMPRGLQTTVYISNPTWPIHLSIFQDQLGFEVKEYPYWCEKTKGVDFDGLSRILSSAPDSSVIIAHACAHNPTGQDLSHDQWDWLFRLCATHHHLLILDCAYQGFASGDFAKDGWAVNRAYELLKSSGSDARLYNYIVCQSYAKNMSLYGHRTGCCHVVCRDADAKIKVHGHLAKIARRIWSNPPRMGSDICKVILTDPELRSAWLTELKGVSAKIQNIRSVMRARLEELLPGTSWKHLTDQIGMFAYTGLKKPQCEQLREQYAIYLMDSGRVSLAGVQPDQVDTICKAIAAVYRS